MPELKPFTANAMQTASVFCESAAAAAAPRKITAESRMGTIGPCRSLSTPPSSAPPETEAPAQMRNRPATLLST